MFMVACTIQGTDIPASALLLTGGNSCHWQWERNQVINFGNDKKKALFSLQNFLVRNTVAFRLFVANIVQL